MNNVGGLVRKGEGFTDIINTEDTKVYKHNGELYIVSYDGELYNQESIREELISGGYFFVTDEEEEVILKAYLEWKGNALSKFEGIFSFAVWSVDAKKIFLARDPIGAKSMFFSVLKDGLIFGNSAQIILKTKEVLPEVTYEGIAELLTLGPSRRQNSAIFRNITQLEAGSYLEYDFDSLIINKYDGFEAYEFLESFDDAVENVREMVIDSILKQFPKDESVCTLLSGGLDSSIVTAIVSEAVKHNGRVLKTFSVDYEGNETYFEANNFQPDSDKEWIEKMVKFLGTEHTVFKLSNEELADSLEDALIARGFPGMGDIDTSLLKFCQKMSKYANVGLGGECADEVFGGYPWFHREDLTGTDFFPWIRSVKERSEYINNDIRENIDVLKFAKDVYDSEIRKVPVLTGESGKERRIREIGYLTYRWFLPVLLERQDKMSKKAGFKIRAPFCNFELMKYVYNIPWEYRTGGGMEKGLLRAAFKDFLPKEVVERKKSPYPKTYNPKYKELIARELRHVLENPTSPLLDVISVPKVYELLAENDVSERPWFGQLMKGPQVMAFLIQVNNWLKDNRVVIV